MEHIKHIAVVVAGIDEEYQSNIINGMNRFVKENGICISYFAAFGGMVNSQSFDRGEYSIYKLINFSKFDGAILLTNTICDTVVTNIIVDTVMKAKIPTVVFDCDKYPDFYNISIDNFTAMKKIVEHVIVDHGAKSINYISGPLSNPEAFSRYKAFLDVMDEYSLPVDNDMIYYGEFRSQDGRLAVEKFGDVCGSLPDAIICANDAMALTAVTSLNKLGYKVPDDIIVTGFDYTYNAQNFSPSLTSVKRPLSTAGYKACELLFKVIRGDSVQKTVTLDAYPVFSESCGCTNPNVQDLVEFKKRSYAKSQNTNTAITMLNNLTAILAETKKEEDLYNALDAFFEELGCDKFALCLAEDWVTNKPIVINETFETPYTEFMTAPYIREFENIRNVDLFNSSQMFPEPEVKAGSINYFLPIHYNDSTLGYYIMTNTDFPVSSLLCHSFTMSISNTVENLRKISHLQQANKELDWLSSHDALCDILNRTGFIKKADKIYKQCIAENQRVMVTFIDMDGLKSINDNYGHKEGDFALKELSRIISKCSKLENGICARFGGDEFLIMKPNPKDDDIDEITRRINVQIDNKNEILNRPYKLSASIGSSISDASEDITLNSIISKADKKMYSIKAEKKDSRANINVIE